MEILATQYIKRKFDGLTEKVVKVRDYENSYSYRNDSGNTVTITPEKWIVVDVIGNGPLTPERVAGVIP